MVSDSVSPDRACAHTRILQETWCTLLGFHAMIWMNDFTSEPEELSRQELAAIERGLRSGRFILGNEVQQFKEGWAKSCGARFGVGVATRMEAIEFVLR